MSGLTIISLTVGENGKPENVKVFRSMADQFPVNMQDAAKSLDINAVKAVRKYRFEPATLNGKPVPFDIKIEVNFQIR